MHNTFQHKYCRGNRPEIGEITHAHIILGILRVLMLCLWFLFIDRDEIIPRLGKINRLEVHTSLILIRP